MDKNYQGKVTSLINWLGSLAALPYLALASVAYFIAIRMLQDYLYTRMDFIAQYGQYFPGYPFRPEPYETPLYLFGFAVIPSLALALRWIAQRRVWLVGILAVGSGAAGLLLGPRLLRLASTLPTRGRAAVAFAHAYFTRRTPLDLAYLVLTKRRYVLMLLTAAALAAASIVAWRTTPQFLRRMQAAWRSAVARPMPRWLPLAVLLGLAGLLGHPNVAADESHYDYWVGPVNDMFAGKRWLIDVTNQYGVLNHLLLAIAYWFAGGAVNYGLLSLLIEISFLIFFLLLAWFLHMWLRSWVAALAGLGLLLAGMYGLLISPVYSPYHFPNIVPLRYGWYALALLPLVHWLRLGSADLRGRRWRELCLVIAGLAPLWNTDSGLYLMGATLAVLAADAVRTPGPWVRRSLGAFAAALRIAGYLALGVAAVSVGVLAAYGVWPDWQLLLGELASYRLGRALNPLPAVGSFLWFVLAYLASLLWVARRAAARQVGADELVVLFLAVLGALSLNYYIGNSAWNLLYPVAGPLLLLVTYFTHRFLLHGAELSPGVRRAGLGGIAAGVTVAALVLIVKLPIEFSHRDYAHPSLTAVTAQDLPLQRDAQRLIREYPDLNRVPLIHQQGDKLMLLARRTNYFPIFELTQIYFVRQMDELIHAFAVAPTPYVFIGKDRDPQMQYFIDRALPSYQVVAGYETLEVFAASPPRPEPR